MEKVKNKIWLYLDIAVISSVIILNIWGWFDDRNQLMGTIFFITIGIFSIYSNQLKEKLYFSKIINWVMMNIFKPKTKYNHIIWGTFFILIGLLMLTLEPLSPPEKDFFDKIKKTPEFWISTLLVLLFNFIVGLYTSKKRKT
ncbi:MAG: hypothetical protein C4522_09320 [Desulfobacteraceae bacterium]|nr:MAG: hypothetical protein C4522_09320 [Desulfobacteraceae bacterium]